MVIIYRGSRPLFPMIACQVHFGDNREALNRIQELANVWNWHREPLAVIGRDKLGSTICCLVHGKHGSIYHRALQGVSRIFEVHSCIIDVDALMAKRASYYLWMATCLDLINWPLDRYTQHLKRLMTEHIMQYIVPKSR